MKRLVFIYAFFCLNSIYAQDCLQYIYTPQIDKFTDVVLNRSKSLNLVNEKLKVMGIKEELTFEIRAYKSGDNPSLSVKCEMNYKGSPPRVYFLFENGEKTVMAEGDENIYGTSHPFGYFNDVTFWFSVGQNPKTLQKIQTYKLKSIRFEMPSKKIDSDLTNNQQDFFINVFRCFAKN